MDDWGWEHLTLWSCQREALPRGPLFCIIDGPTAGRPWPQTGARAQLRCLAVQAGVRRRFAPHQLRHAHAVEMAREGVLLNVIQRQLGHSNLGVTSVYLQGIDSAEVINAVHDRRPPMMPAEKALERVLQMPFALLKLSARPALVDRLKHRLVRVADHPRRLALKRAKKSAPVGGVGVRERLGVPKLRPPRAIADRAKDVEGDRSSGYPPAAGVLGSDPEGEMVDSSEPSAGHAVGLWAAETIGAKAQPSRRRAGRGRTRGPRP